MRLPPSGYVNRFYRDYTGLVYSSEVSSRIMMEIWSPAMMYGADTWAVKKAQEKKLDVAEMRMLRWMSGVTKMDRLRKEWRKGVCEM